MVLELVKDEDIRYNRKSEIKCRLCKDNKTRIASGGEPIWTRDKNSIGDWTGQFICYDCYYNGDKICNKCGTEQITKSVQMMRYYNRGIWTGKFLCKDCYNKIKTDYKNRNINLKIGEGGGSLLDIVVSKVLDVPTYSIYIADKRLPFSIIHEDYGIVGIKASILIYNYWYFNINDYLSADTYFLIGFDEKLKNIQAIYVIPIFPDARKISRFNICKNSQKYKDFRIDHIPYNNEFKCSINND